MRPRFHNLKETCHAQTSHWGAVAWVSAALGQPRGLSECILPGAPANRYLAGIGVNLCPTASVMAANILVAGEEQTLSRGSLARVGDSAQSPDAMSLLVFTATVTSLAA